MTRRYNHCSPHKSPCPPAPCPPEPACCAPCPKASDDAFIRSIFAPIDLLDGEAFAAFFAPSGVEDLPDFAIVYAGRPAIAAGNVEFFGGLRSARTDILSITRLVNDDCTVVVAVELNFTFVGNGTGFIADGAVVFGNHTVYLTFNGACLLTYYQDFVRFEKTTPPPPPPSA
jgi:hypothetical protein